MKPGVSPVYTVEQDAAYRNLDEEAYEMIACCTNSAQLLEKKEDYREKEGMNMCQALDELIEDGRQEGRREGHASGLREGHASGLKAGLATGHATGLKEGLTTGIQLLSQLNLRLIKEKRYEDLKRVQSDDGYRSKLFEEYGIRVAQG